MGCQGRNRLKRPFIYGVLAFLIIFHAANSIAVLRADRVPFVGDAGRVYAGVASAVKGGSGLFAIAASLYADTDDIHPPLFGTISGITYAFLGKSQDAAVLANTLFFSLLLIGTYLLGKELFVPEIGLLAAIVLSFFPGVYSLSRAFMSDFSVGTLVTLSLVMLVQRRYLHSRAWAALFGLCLGLAALSQPFFSLFLVGPFTFVLGVPMVKALLARDRHSASVLLARTILIMSVAILVAGPWYLRHAVGYFGLQGCRSALLTHLSATPLVPLHVGFWNLISSYLYSPVAYLFVIALAHFSIREKTYRGLLLSWMTIPYLVFLLVGADKDILLHLVMFPAVPAVALVMGYSLYRSIAWLPHRHGRILGGFLLALLLGEVLLFYLTTYGTVGSLSALAIPESQGLRAEMIRINYLGRRSPRDPGFRTDETVRTLLSGPEPPAVFFLNPYGPVSDALRVELSAQAPSRNARLLSCLEGLTAGECVERWRPNDDCQALIRSADFVVAESVSTAPSNYEVWSNPSAQDAGLIASFVRSAQETVLNDTVLWQLWGRGSSDGTSPSSALWPGSDVLLLRKR